MLMLIVLRRKVKEGVLFEVWGSGQQFSDCGGHQNHGGNLGKTQQALPSIEEPGCPPSVLALSVIPTRTRPHPAGLTQLSKTSPLSMNLGVTEHHIST